MAKKRMVVDSSTLGARILFNELVECEREGTIIHVRSRSGRFERCGSMTEGYARKKVAALTRLLAEMDAERPTPRVVEIRKR